MANQLILAIDHIGHLEDIQKSTWLIKTKYFPDDLLYFASVERDKDLFDFIKQHNFSFYSNKKSKSPILTQVL